MEIAKSVQENLESQMEQYEALLNFAKTKAKLLSEPSNKAGVQEMNNLVRQEVKVVSVLTELERKRKEISGEKKFDEIISQAGELAQPLCVLKEKLKDAGLALREINQRNHQVLEVSLKVIGKVLQAVKDLNSTKALTYSRVRKKPAVQGQQGFRAFDLKA